MRVIFVGMHNKPNKAPLCSSTKSGKMVDKIIAQVDGFTIKTNLFDIDYFPIRSEHDYYANGLEYIEAHNISEDDICVLMGKFVQENFPKTNATLIKIPHPSYPRSHEAKAKYVENAVKSIQRCFEIPTNTITLQG